MAHVTPALFHAALEVARNALPHIPERNPALSEIAARVYNILADNYPDPTQPPDPSALASMSANIAAQWRASATARVSNG